MRPLSLPGRPLTRFERLRLVVEILFAYGELLPVLRRNDLPAMIRVARRGRGRRLPPPGAEVHLIARRLGWIVQLCVSRLPSDRRCLIHSLVTVRVLAERSIDGALVIGVRSGPAGVEAHAWVEHEHHPILPAGDYERLVEL